MILYNLYFFIDEWFVFKFIYKRLLLHKSTFIYIAIPGIII
uniref:Uncharacterized protein n=1 Tax=Bartonella rochalimae ATCC BAA-1498 TaxID=685782 RepID=E6YMH9_9HYPH|nr:hypothetical protein BARRO_50430 [Bartonella rochalimae ATCC BAA-1498]